MKQSTLENVFCRQMKIEDAKRKGIKQQSQLEIALFESLSKESESFQSDVILLINLIRGGPNQSLMLADLEIMNKAFNRFYVFLPEFHKRKKLPIESSKIPFTICFTSRVRQENLERPSLFQLYHTFDVTVVQDSVNKRCSP